METTTQTVHDVRTPNGNRAQFLCRDGTNDRQIVAHATELDEYRLARFRPRAQWAVDVGAHVGAVAVCLAIDHPDLMVLAVEPVPENAALIRNNAALNGVPERVVVDAAAAASDLDGRTVKVFRPGAQHFVGNADGDGFDLACDSASLTQLLERHGAGDVALLKLDCEGCETDVLADPAVARIPLIVGEYHNNVEQVMAALRGTHTLVVSGYTFWASL